jgi:serine/threonine protein kinase
MAKFFNRLSQAFQKTQAAPVLGVGALVNGRYRLDAEIGRGGMGIVYRAHDIPNDRDVAIKVINQDTANALTLGQFSREIEITTLLSHPHIVTIHEVGTVDLKMGEPTPFIVMELLQGKSLAEVSGLTYATIIDIAKQVCDALGYIHERGFVYRDLKPGNVILEKRGFGYFVKLLDFGLARPRVEAYLPHESNLAGTVFYLAPELIAGQPADVGSDLYALGAMLYEMVTGRVPFSDIDEKNVIDQHVNEKVPPPSQSRSDMPPALESIILRLLEKNPKDRFASAGEVHEALEQIAMSGESSPHGNLPQADFSANDDDVAKVIQLLESNQLVTLLSDNETLALAVGEQLTTQFADGVWLVKLDSVDEPGMVLRTVASTLGVIEDQDRPLTVSLIATLREKHLLLILSHCGHLLFACAQLVDTILRSCPEVRILVTSKQPLNITGEKCVE